MFDFANSSYTTIIVTLVFSIYFVTFIVPESLSQHSDFYWSLGLFIANMLTIILAPLVGAMADHTGHKKRYLIAVCLISIAGTAMLYFALPEMMLFSIFFLVISLTAFSLGEGLCSSYLPELAPEKDLGKISGIGWGLGYIGGLAVIALCFPLLKDGFTAENVDGIRATNLVVAVFFLVATLPTFIFLKDRIPPQPIQDKSIFVSAWSNLADTFTHLCQYRALFTFFFVMLIFSFTFPYRQYALQS